MTFKEKVMNKISLMGLEYSGHQQRVAYEAWKLTLHQTYKDSWLVHHNGVGVRSHCRRFSYIDGQLYETVGDHFRTCSAVGKEYFADWPKMTEDELTLFELETGYDLKDALEMSEKIDEYNKTLVKE